MIAVIQRVRSSSVSIDGKLRAKVGAGLNILIGVGDSDGFADVRALADKISNLRIFSDENGKMNLSLIETLGEALIISQFTLLGDCKKGRRPSFIGAAAPAEAIPLYEAFIAEMEGQIGTQRVKCGVFGADMSVEIINDGPVTIILDSKKL